MNASASEKSYDIVIAGGGMVGSCLALALAPLGLRLAVVEAVARDAAQQPSFDDRSTALSRSSQRMFEAMGLWDRIAATATPIRSIHVSERGSFGFAHLDAGEQRVAALGYVVINRVLGTVLQTALRDKGNVDVLCPARIAGLRAEQDACHVRVEAGDGVSRLRCELLVAADGAESSVREMLGIDAMRRDYGQQAIIGNVLPERDPAGRAFERFTRSGALALLPVAERRAAFVWAQSTADANDCMQLSDAMFLERLQEEFGQRLGTFSRIGRRAVYPLALTRANRLTATRSVLVGNAAHGLHPIAAQGFNLGLRDVATLCDCIADELERSGEPASIGSDRVLEAYSRWRRPDHRKVVGFTDGLVRLFSPLPAPLRLLRHAGMLAFDFLPGVRRQFARHTMGLAGRLPRLSRGVPLR